MRGLVFSLLVVVGILVSQPATPLDRDEVMRLLGKELGGRVLSAVKRGCEFLKSQQQPDGHWEGKYLSLLYPDGVTALTLYALLKGGTPKDDESVKKGFAWLRKTIAKNGFRTVYSTSCIILALSALMEPPPIKKERERLLKKPTIRTTAFKPEDERKRRAARKAPKWAKDLLRRAVAWLLKQQQKDIWRYPGPQPGGRGGGGGPNIDASNTQYAMLALHEAMRCGISVPKDVFIRAAEYFLTHQEKSGPEVKSFPVPGADLSIRKLKKLEKQILKAMEEEWKAQVREWKKAKGGEKPSLKMPKTTAVEVGDPYKRLKGEKGKMWARGWSYTPEVKGMRLPDDWLKTTGSMTTSGVICLIIAKSQIEGKVPKQTLKRINQAIRDGMAWLARNFTVSSNPNASCWHLYYLYGVERCGVLTLTEKLGSHNWYKEGAEYLIGAQLSDGSWREETEQVQWASGTLGHGSIESTCFAILFLGRATTPIIGEKTVKTGLGMFGQK